MTHPTDDTSPAGEHTPGAGAASDGGWRRWMPRRRTDPATAGPPAVADEAADDTPPTETPAADAAESAPAADAAESAPASSAEGSGGGSARRWMPRRRTTAQPADESAEPVTGSIPSAEGSDADDEAADDEPVTAATAAEGVGRLRRKRKRLLSEREVTVYHLGGLAFELYRHDRLHPEVMQRRAGEIALIDETVHDIDLRLEQLAADRRNRRTRDPDPRAPVGNCMSCRAPFQVDARFCWQCGAQLLPDLPDPPSDVAPDTQATQTIERPTP